MVRPGDLRLVLGSPPSRWTTTSVDLRRPLTREMPATYLPPHFTRNLNDLYGSKRLALTVNSGMDARITRGNVSRRFSTRLARVRATKLRSGSGGLRLSEEPGRADC